MILTKGNESGPRTDLENAIFTLVLVLDLIVAANVFGQVAVLVIAANRRSTAFQAKID